ncbi:MAG: inorganic diphosphatase [Candidatus Sumerlaeaceae bacterium]
MKFEAMPAGESPPDILNCIVEVPKGCSLKFEYNEEYETFVLDRVLHSPLFYPCDYGFIPQTRSEDGDHLDVLIVVTLPSFPGAVIPARPVGLLKMFDDKGQDYKVLAVPVGDPRFKEVRNLPDLGEHIPLEISHFFQIYKDLEHKTVEVVGWGDVDEARVEVLRSMEMYKERG